MKQLGEFTVAEYMSQQAVVVDDTEKLTRAISLIDDRQISALPVVDQQGVIVGILSTTDLVEITHELQSDIGALHHVQPATQDFLIKMLMEQGDNTTVRDVMTEPVETITPETNLVVAAKKLVERRYHHLPVVDDKGTPIGMISTSDFVRVFAEQGALYAG